MKRYVLYFLRGLVSVLLVLGAVLPITATYAQTSIPTPDQDPFYAPPAGYENMPNGSILRDRTINAEYLLPLFSTDVANALIGTPLGAYVGAFKNLRIRAYQVLYKSLDNDSKPVAEVATILVSEGPAWSGPGPRPLVSYQSAEDSVGLSCAPSYTIRTGLLGQGALSGTFDLILSLPLLLEGYAVVYPDHEGPQSQFLVGRQSGQATLDAIRAALRYAPAGIAANAPIGLAGYSGGGAATAWAAELKKSYAPELNIVGAAIGATPEGDVRAVFNNVNGAPLVGFMVEALVAMNRAYPNAKVYDYFTPEGQKILKQTEDKCLGAAAALNLSTGKLEKYTISPNTSLVDSKLFRDIFLPNQNPVAIPDMPIFSYDDQYDDLVPVASSNALAQKYCAGGAKVQVMRTAIPFPNIVPILPAAPIHTSAAFLGAIPATTFLTNRFKGVAMRNDCAWASIWASPLKIPYQPLNVQ